MRVLDKTISDDDLFGGKTNQHSGSAHGDEHKKKYQREQSFKYECDDALGILGNLN
jgi:hypothetical protein